MCNVRNPSATAALSAAPRPVPATVAELVRRPAGSRRGIYTVTASLVAARLEEDDAIHVVIAEPDDPSTTLLTELPAATADGTTDRALCERSWVSREIFIKTFGRPSFEGFTLLYGRARLTIARNDTHAAGRPGYRVLGLAALAGRAPPRCASTG